MKYRVKVIIQNLGDEKSIAQIGETMAQREIEFRGSPSRQDPNVWLSIDSETIDRLIHLSIAEAAKEAVLGRR